MNEIQEYQIKTIVYALQAEGDEIGLTYIRNLADLKREQVRGAGGRLGTGAGVGRACAIPTAR